MPEEAPKEPGKEKAPAATPAPVAAPEPAAKAPAEPPKPKMDQEDYERVIGAAKVILKTYGVDQFIMVWQNPDKPGVVVYGWVGNDTWAVGASRIAALRLGKQIAGV